MFVRTGCSAVVVVVVIAVAAVVVAVVVVRYWSSGYELSGLPTKITLCIDDRYSPTNGK